MHLIKDSRLSAVFKAYIIGSYETTLCSNICFYSSLAWRGRELFTLLRDYAFSLCVQFTLNRYTTSTDQTTGRDTHWLCLREACSFHLRQMLLTIFWTFPSFHSPRHQQARGYHSRLSKHDNEKAQRPRVCSMDKDMHRREGDDTCIMPQGQMTWWEEQTYTQRNTHRE